MVERGGSEPHSSGVPTIAELLLAYRDRTGASYAEMARKVGDELTPARMHQLTTEPPKQFPKLPRTVALLADMLEVPVTTVVLAFAAGLGIPVNSSDSLLALTLPPGTDDLTGEDRNAIVAVTRQLLDARKAARAVPEHRGELIDLARPPAPDLSRVAARRGQSGGRRLRDDQDRDASDRN